MKIFNLFFSNLEKGITNNDLLDGLIDKSIVQYELYKKGFLSDQSEQILLNLMKIKLLFFLTIISINGMSQVNQALLNALRHPLLPIL